MRILIYILLFGVSSTLLAQTKKVKSVDKMPMQQRTNLRTKLAATTKYFSVGNAAISTPPALLNGVFHPLVEVGFTKPFRKNAGKQRLTIGVDAGFFAQKGLQNGFYLKPNVNLNIPIYKSFTITPKLGAGILFTKNSNSEFELQTNGTYLKKSPINPQFLGTIGVQPSVNLLNTKKYKYSVFMSYEFAAQTPFSAISSLLPMTMIRLGLKVQPRSNGSNK